MPRAEKGTPKWLANKMKSKGLQRLRWFCQMCQKQCRDENGFKCHINSESHQRQLLVVAQSPGMFLGEFSHEFEKCFMDLLKRRYGTKRVRANQVYQEYISDKNHLHMNATRWETLTGFVQYLGRTGKCVVDQTERGWFITWIDREPDTLERERQMAKKQKMDIDDAEREQKLIEKQAERAKDQIGLEKLSTSSSFTELQRNDEQKIEFAFYKPDVTKLETKPLLTEHFLGLNKNLDQKPSTSIKVKEKGLQKKLSALDEIRAMEEELKEKRNRKDYWLHINIVVKVIAKNLGNEFYEKKALVESLEDEYTAVVKMLDSGKKLKVDQSHVETVIPGFGRQVLVVNGAYRGLKATLLDVDKDKFCCTIKIAEGTMLDREVNNVQYEDICKLYCND